MKIIPFILLSLVIGLTSCSKPSLRDNYTQSFDDLCASDEALKDLVRSAYCYTSENQHGTGPCTKTMFNTLTKAEASHWTAYNAAGAAWREFIELDSTNGTSARYLKPDTLRQGQTAVPWLDENQHLHFALLPTDQAKTISYTVSLVLDGQGS